VSQHHGAGENEACGAWSWHALYSFVPMAGLVGIAIWFLVDPIFAALAPSATVKANATTYVLARQFGMMGLVGAIALSSFFRGLGDTHTPLWAMLVANAVNIVLDYGLIFGELGLPELGLRGAGVATAVGEWTYFVFLFVVFRRSRLDALHRTQPARFEPGEIRRLLRTGLPVGGQWVLEMLSFAVFTTLVARMSDQALAASQAFISLMSISFMQAIGIGNAVSTLVGRYIGARELDLARKSFRSAQILGIALAAVVATLYVGVPETLLSIFTDDAEVLAFGRPLLAIGAAFQLFDAIAIISDGALRGAGDTRWPFLVRCMLAWGVFLPLAWLFAFPLGLGLTGAWCGCAVQVIVLAALLVRRFRSGSWQQIRI